MHMCKGVCITNIIIHDTTHGLFSEINVFGNLSPKDTEEIISQVLGFQIIIPCSQWIGDNRRPNFAMMLRKGSDGRWVLASEMKRNLQLFTEFHFSQTLLVPGKKIVILSLKYSLLYNKHQRNVFQSFRRQCSNVVKNIGLGIQVSLLVN